MFKFTISIERKEYLETYDEPVYEVLSYNEIKDERQSHVTYTKPVYGKNQISSISKERLVPSEILDVYEQIPLKLGEMSFSCIKTTTDEDYTNCDPLLKSIQEAGDVITTEKLLDIISNANKENKYSPYTVTYGYICDLDNIHSEDYFPNSSIRNNTVKRVIGEEYDFENLDWSDLVFDDYSKQNNSKSFQKSKKSSH